ncbi:hypothetical protein [Streptomyces sp. H27-D2]|uniref:hypothetical protein n=1 Tax=Streptomyces sp. H27-D2 TaxID=3046304 RepID=UPI002DB5ED44|nr:hypothetical protein [Streptomyces sp. H27-D2]
MYVRTVGRGEKRTPVHLSYQVVRSPGEGLRWLYGLLRELPQLHEGGFLESRGWIDPSEDFHRAVRAMENGSQWAVAIGTLDGQAQVTVSEVPMLPLVASDKAKAKAKGRRS